MSGAASQRCFISNAYKVEDMLPLAAARGLRCAACAATLESLLLDTHRAASTVDCGRFTGWRTRRPWRQPWRPRPAQMRSGSTWSGSPGREGSSQPPASLLQVGCQQEGSGNKLPYPTVSYLVLPHPTKTAAARQPAAGRVPAVGLRKHSTLPYRILP